VQDALVGLALAIDGSGADNVYGPFMRLLTRVVDRVGHALHGAPPPSRRIERRDPATRPKDGDTRSCPSCRGVLLFRESYRILRIERNTMEPAWVCHTHPCGFRQFLRR
jgi:hypothetical protein